MTVTFMSNRSVLQMTPTRFVNIIILIAAMYYNDFIIVAQIFTVHELLISWLN